MLPEDIIEEALLFLAIKALAICFLCSSFSKVVSVIMEAQYEAVGIWLMDTILRKLSEDTLESGSKEALKMHTPNAWINGK